MDTTNDNFTIFDDSGLIFPELNTSSLIDWPVKIPDLCDTKDGLAKATGGSGPDFLFYMHGLLLTLLMVIALPWNIGLMIAFICKRLGRPCLSDIYMVCTLASDTVLLISSWVLFSYPTLCDHIHQPSSPEHSVVGIWYVKLFNSVYYMVNVSSTICVWTTLALTVERSVAVVAPLRSRVSAPSSNSRLKFQITLCFVAIMFNVPRLLEVTSVTCIDLSISVNPQLFLAVTDLYRSEQYAFLYRQLSHMILVSVGPHLVIMGFTGVLLHNLRQAEKRFEQVTSEIRRSSMSSNSHGDHHKAARMIPMFALKFVACYMLVPVNDLVEFLAPRFYHATSFGQYSIATSNVLVCLNSASNAWLITVFSNRLTATRNRIKSCRFCMFSRLQSSSECPELPNSGSHQFRQPSIRFRKRQSLRDEKKSYKGQSVRLSTDCIENAKLDTLHGTKLRRLSGIF